MSQMETCEQSNYRLNKSFFFKIIKGRLLKGRVNERHIRREGGKERVREREERRASE